MYTQFHLQEKKDRNKLLHSITSEQNQQHHWDQIPDTNPKCYFHPRTVNSNQQNKLWSNLWIRKGHTPQKPSQPRMMKRSLSVRSKEWISGVATSPTCMACYSSELQEEKKKLVCKYALVRPSVVNRRLKKIVGCLNYATQQCYSHYFTFCTKQHNT